MIFPTSLIDEFKDKKKVPPKGYLGKRAIINIGLFRI